MALTVLVWRQPRQRVPGYSTEGGLWIGCIGEYLTVFLGVGAESSSCFA
jgi:hypothetical protein